MTIGIIDYGGGNIQSVKNALLHLRADFQTVKSPEDIIGMNKMILPGQGAFGPTVNALKQRGLFTPVREYIDKGNHFLGICIGLQLLFEQSEESPGVDGFGILKGGSKKFSKGNIPQIGWNSVIPLKDNNLDKGYGYFANSFYVLPEEDETIASLTDYYGNFVSAVQINNIFATQFHPEKSGKWGLYILRRWTNAD